MSLMLSTSVIAIVAAADAYAVGGNSPELVCDFSTELYRKNGSTSDFDNVLTYTGATLGTMVDSSGNLVWAPHNLLVQTEDIEGSSWSTSGTFTVTDSQSDPDGGTDAQLFTCDASGDCKTQNAFYFAHAADTYKYSVAAKYSAGNGWLMMFLQGITDTATWFDVQNGSIGTVSSKSTATMTSLGDGWYLCTIEVSGTGASIEATIELADADTSSTADAGDALFIHGPRLIESTFGMLDNPATGTSYVKNTSTSAEKHLPRRGHYKYNGSSWVNKGILLESDAATNLISQSHDFSTTWTNNNSTEAADQTGPDGVANSAYTITDDSGTGTGEVYIDFALTGLSTSTVYSFSVFLKADQLSWAALGTENFTTPANGETFFNLSAGSVGTEASGHTGRIEDFNGWYRCSITFTTDGSDTSGNVRIYVADADTDITVDRDGTSSIMVYGAQMEQGLVSSYIPTAGISVTRNAETLVVGSANTAPSTTAISWQIDGEINYVDEGVEAQHTFLRWQSDASNLLSLDLDTDSTATGEVNANQEETGTLDTVVAAAEYSPGLNVAFNIAARHEDGEINVAKDGTAATADTTPTALVDLSAVDLDIGQDFNGTIAQVRVWENVGLTDAQLQTATT